MYHSENDLLIYLRELIYLYAIIIIIIYAYAEL